ncbi:MAG: threonine synthase [Myxococcota bacterium]
MQHIRHLECVQCRKTHAYGSVDYTCPACGPDKGILDVIYDYERIFRTYTPAALTSDTSFNVWRYRPLLPVDPSWTAPQLHIGWTPLYDFPALARDLGIRQLRVKDDGRQPTASFKDRASSLGVWRAAQQGAKVITCASTGNAASSLAGWSAHFGLKAFIFVPHTAPEAKLAQLLIYGANVLLVEGSYDQAYDLCQQAVGAFGWFNRNCAVNPFLVEGKKTGGLELGEQLGNSEPADWVAVPLGDGCTTAGIWKGLKEMKAMGVLSRTPRILAVQAEGSSPLHKAWVQGTETFVPEDAKTIADSICVGTPRNAVKALRAIRESGGAVVTVPDGLIDEWMPRLARNTGVFAEPTAVAALAGIHVAKQRGIVGKDESVVHYVTGHGLKDSRGALRAAPSAHKVAPRLDAVRDVVERVG